jgi:hypothetical protein
MNRSYYELAIVQKDLAATVEPVAQDGGFTLHANDLTIVLTRMLRGSELWKMI